MKKKKKTGNKTNKLMKEQDDKQDKFTYLAGLTTNEFDCFECVEPFLHQISYPHCKGGGLETKSRKLDTKAELMAFSSTL